MTPVMPPRPQRMRIGIPAVLALGSNLGDREATIRGAIERLESTPGIRVEAVSHLVETPAIKPDGVDHDAPSYLNAVAVVATTLDPHALLDAVNAIENDNGRIREERWGDRTLDIDLIDVDGLEVSDERLTLPHPRAWQRAFVLAPWLEIQPDATLGHHGRIDALLEAAEDVVWPYPREAGEEPTR